jgi:phage terminase large subunit-like protein
MATEEQQSITTVFGGVVEMLRLAQDHFPDEFQGVDAGLTRIYLPGGGQMRPSTASAASKDGGRETLAIVDEGHLHTSTELIEAYRTVRRNLAKRPGSWLLECSTMFAPGEGSIMEQSWEYSRKQLDHHDDMTFLWDHREGTEVADFDNDEELLDSLKAAYGAAAAIVPLDEIMAEVRDPTCEPAEAMRYFLNLRVAGDGRCIDPVVWQGRAEPNAKIEGPIAIGFDGSLMRANGDATVLMGCTLSEPRHLFVLGAWEQPEEECWHEVEAAVAEAFNDYDVALFYADRARWGPRIDAWYAKWPKAMKTWPATSMRRVGQGFADFSSALITGRMTHDDDPMLSRHVTNAVRRYVAAKDSDGSKMWIASKDTHGSSRRIDAYYAGMLAHTAALEATAAGYKARRKARLVTF